MSGMLRRPAWGEATVTYSSIFLGHCVVASLGSLLVVYLNELDPTAPNAAIVMLFFALSYLVSMFAAGPARRRYALGSALLMMAWGLSWLGLTPPASAEWRSAALSICIVGLGVYRPSIVALTDRRRAAHVVSSRAFAVLGVIINLGYAIGPFLADLLRAATWRSVFQCLAVVGCVGGVLALAQGVVAGRVPAEQGTTERPSLGFLTLLFANVALNYGIQGQLLTVLGLVIEHETTSRYLPVQVQAGSLAGIHGMLVVLASLGYFRLTRNRAPDPATMTTLALVLYSVGFAALAIVEFPVDQAGVLITFGLFSVGEALVIPNLLALANTLAGPRKGIFWLAAGVGYSASSLLGYFWMIVSHRVYFASIAMGCLVHGLLVLWRSDAAEWRGSR